MRKRDESVMMSSSSVPRYLEIAEDEIGVKEFKGKEHHPRILEYHDTTTLGSWGRSRDETPWCSSFINFCVTKAGLEGTNNALARSWMSWGLGVDVPMPGDIVVLKRRKRGSDARTGSRGGYHVAIFIRASRGRVRLLGGNQRDAVRYSWYSQRRYDIKAIRRATA
jgi:uncharacterized protein (TIGR02594 family)